MQIISHRSNLEGVDRIKENTVLAVSFCLEQGWGIETDIRRAGRCGLAASMELWSGMVSVAA
jgi:hypothetical protein